VIDWVGHNIILEAGKTLFSLAMLSLGLLAAGVGVLFVTLRFITHCDLESTIGQSLLTQAINAVGDAARPDDVIEGRRRREQGGFNDRSE